jgi:hypothetical protein
MMTDTDYRIAVLTRSVETLTKAIDAVIVTNRIMRDRLVKVEDELVDYRWRVQKLEGGAK